MKKKIRIPDTYVIIFFVVVFAAILTYIIPVGSFTMEKIQYATEAGMKTRTVPVPGSFKYALNDLGQPLTKGIPIFAAGGDMSVTNYIFEGLVSGDKWGTAVGIIAFILITGGAVFGMGEEAIPFAMILIPIVVGMGYDSITGIFMCYISTQIGFATSWMNPFSVAIAQGVAGVPVLSGAMFRIVMWIFFTSFGIIYTMRYAKKVKANPELSISYETDKFFRDDFKADESEDLEFKFGHKLVFLTIFLGMSWIIWGVVFHGYYLPEIAAQFTIMGIVSGIIGVIFKLNDMTVNDIAISFRKGAEDLIGAAMVVGMAKGIVLVLGGVDAGTPTVLNTVLNSVAGVLSHLHASISAVAMYFFQSIFNFFVVSGSGQAALTMPIMAPLSDLVGVPRQVAVLAFQLGDGFTNMFVPTSGILMAILGIAKIEWGVWAKLQIKFQGILFLLGSIFMIVGVLIKLQ